MKKTIRIIIPVILIFAIIFCSAWYLLVYDQEFTRDVLLSLARFNERQGNHTLATSFYNSAYSQAGNSDEVAIELAQQFKKLGNYTKAEFTLSNAIANGGGIELYIALCKTYVEQDKLLDAVNMLNNVTNPEIRTQLDSMRPAAPLASPDPAFYSQYISVTLTAESSTIYASINGEYPSIKNIYTDPLTLHDGENTIYAIAANENGLVSAVSIFGYTVGGVIERLEFSDAAIEEAVRSVLNVPNDKVLYTNDLWAVKTFTVPSDAKNYAELKHMIFLEELTVDSGISGQLTNIGTLSSLKKLTIRNTTVSQEELSIIASLPVLEELTLSEAGLSGIAPLASASSLKVLDVSGNTIRNIDSVKNLTALTDLNLSRNALTDVSALADITSLINLDLSFNNITSLSPITGLIALKKLNASTNTLTDLGDIGELTALTSLSLGSNKLTDVTGISLCTDLTELDISTNELTNITSLSTLKKLININFSYNKISAIPAFSKDCQLVTIDGSNNEISSLEPLSGLPYLNTVNMDYNSGISSVAPLANCPVLIKVNVFATKVTEVTVLTDQSIEVNFNPVQDR